MAYAIVGTTNGFTQAATNASLSLTFSGTQPRTAGDLLILPVAGTGTATFPTTPAGWSVAIQRAGTSCSATVFYKVAAGADASPVVAALASTQWGGILWEFSGGASASPVDQTGSNVGTTTSPIVATAGGTDAASGELVISAAAQLLSVAATDTLFLQTGPNGQVDFGNNQQGNDATSTVNHSNVAWGIRTTASSADSSSVAHKTTSVTGVAVALASFKLLVATSVPPGAMWRDPSTMGRKAVYLTGRQRRDVVPAQVPVPSPVFPNRVPALERRLFQPQPRGRLSMPTPPWFPTTSVLDPFNNRPAENPTLYGGRYVPTFGPLSNAIAQTNGTFGLTTQAENTGSGAVWSVPFARPIEAYITLAAVPSGANDFSYIGLFTASPFTSGYELRVQTSVSGWLLGRWDSAVRTTLASGTQPLANGGAIGLSIDASGVIGAWYSPPNGDWLSIGGANDTTYAGSLSIGWRTVDTFTRFSNFGGGTTGIAVGPLYPFVLGGSRLAGRRVALPPTRGRQVFPTQTPFVAPPPWPIIHRAPEVSQRALVPLLRFGRRSLPVPPPLAPYQIESLSGRKSHAFTATVTPRSTSGLLVVTGALWNGGVGVPTISDTWGLGWSVASGYDATSQALTFVAWATPTSATSGTITVGESTGNNSVVLEVLQVTGPVSSANPIANVGSSATATVSLADTPRADSLVISVAGYATGGGQSGLSPPDASWGVLETFVKDNFVVFGAAFKDGSAPKTIAWTGGTNLSTVAIEILNANTTLGWIAPQVRRPPARVVAYRGSRLRPVVPAQQAVAVTPYPWSWRRPALRGALGLLPRGHRLVRSQPAPVAAVSVPEWRDPSLKGRLLVRQPPARRAEHIGLQYIRFIQRVGASQATATTTSVTPGAATTAGNTLFAVLRIASAVALSSVTDTQGNTWYIDVPSPIPALSGSNSFIARAPNAASLSTGDSITAHGASSAAIEMVVLEFSGVGAFDQEAWTHQSSSSDTVTTGTLASFYELAITGYASGSVAQPTITSPKGWVEVASVPTAWDDSAYTILGESTAAISASWAASSGINSGASLATYMPAALVQMVPAPRGRAATVRLGALVRARLRPVVSTTVAPTAPTYVPPRSTAPPRLASAPRGRRSLPLPGYGQGTVVFGTPVSTQAVASASSYNIALSGVVSGQPIIVFSTNQSSSVSASSITDTFATPYLWTLVTTVHGQDAWIGTGGAGTSGTITANYGSLLSIGGTAWPCINATSAGGLSAVDVSANATITSATPGPPSLTPNAPGEGALYFFLSVFNSITANPGSPWTAIAQKAGNGFPTAGSAATAGPAPGVPVSGNFTIGGSNTDYVVGLVVKGAIVPPPFVPLRRDHPAGRRIAALVRGRATNAAWYAVSAPLAPSYPPTTRTPAGRRLAGVARGRRSVPPFEQDPLPGLGERRETRVTPATTRRGRSVSPTPRQIPVPAPVFPTREPATARRSFELTPRGRRWWPIPAQVPVPAAIPTWRAPASRRIAAVVRGRRTLPTPEATQLPLFVYRRETRLVPSLLRRGRIVYPTQPQIPVPPTVPGNRWPTGRGRIAATRRGRAWNYVPAQIFFSNPGWVPPGTTDALRSKMAAVVRGRRSFVVPPQVAVPPTIPGNRSPAGRRIAALRRGRRAEVTASAAQAIPVGNRAPAGRRIAATRRGARIFPTPAQVPVPPHLPGNRSPSLRRRLFALQPRGRRAFPTQPQIPVPILVPAIRVETTARRLFAITRRGRSSTVVPTTVAPKYVPSRLTPRRAVVALSRGRRTAPPLAPSTPLAPPVPVRWGTARRVLVGAAARARRTFPWPGFGKAGSMAGTSSPSSRSGVASPAHDDRPVGTVSPTQTRGGVSPREVAGEVDPTQDDAEV